VDEWKSSCEAGKLKKRGDVWEWTSTDADMGGQTYKAALRPEQHLRLLSPLFAAVEKRRQRLSLCARCDPRELVAGFVLGRNVYVGNGELTLVPWLRASGLNDVL
jgi:hypothetical protein